MNDAGVPESVEELHARYDRLIAWEINRATRRRLQPEEVDDLRQQVYLRVVNYNFLDRCRVYYASHEGRFSNSLLQLVRNLTNSELSSRTRNPLFLSQSAPLPQREDGEEPDVLAGIPYCDRHEEALLARDALQRLGRRLDRPRQTVRTSAILREALTTGLRSVEIAQSLKTRPGTVRSHLHDVRREAARMGLR